MKFQFNMWLHKCTYFFLLNEHHLESLQYSSLLRCIIYSFLLAYKLKCSLYPCVAYTLCLNVFNMNLCFIQNTNFLNNRPDAIFLLLLISNFNTFLRSVSEKKIIKIQLVLYFISSLFNQLQCVYMFNLWCWKFFLIFFCVKKTVKQH